MVFGGARYFAGADKRVVTGCPICHWCRLCWLEIGTRGGERLKQVDEPLSGYV